MALCKFFIELEHPQKSHTTDQLECVLIIFKLSQLEINPQKIQDGCHLCSQIIIYSSLGNRKTQPSFTFHVYFLLNKYFTNPMYINQIIGEKQSK